MATSPQPPMPGQAVGPAATPSRTRRALPFGFLALLMLGGCAESLAQRQARLQQFVGQPVNNVISVMGVPNRSYSANGVNYIAYLEQHIEVVPPAPIVGPPWVFGWYNPFPAQVVNWQCETTFTVAGGIVRGVSLHGNACG